MKKSSLFVVILVMSIAFAYLLITDENTRNIPDSHTKSMGFLIKPKGIVGMWIAPTTRPGIIAFKVNAIGKIRFTLVKKSRNPEEPSTKLQFINIQSLEVQRMDVVKFFCDACGATLVLLQSEEDGDNIQGKITQLE